MAGSITIGIIVGLISGNWGLFIIVTLALIAASLATHDIRLPQKPKR